MKYLYAALILIVLLLLLIFLRLGEVNATLSASSQDDRRLIDSNLAVVSSNQRLENGLLELRKQIADIGERLVPAGKQPR